MTEIREEGDISPGVGAGQSISMNDNQDADKSEEVQKASNELYGRLREAGIDVILDDRGLRPGVMFADWELIGVPHRVTIGDRGLKNGEVEYAHRGDLQNENVPVTEIADKLIAKIKVR